MTILMNKKVTTLRRPKVTQLGDKSLTSILSLLGIERDKNGDFDEQKLADILHGVLHDNDILSEDVDRYHEDIQRLMQFMNDTEKQMHTIEYSKAWKFGFGALRFAKQLLGRPTQQSGFKKINDTFALYHHWKKARG